MPGGKIVTFQTTDWMLGRSAQYRWLCAGGAQRVVRGALPPLLPLQGPGEPPRPGPSGMVQTPLRNDSIGAVHQWHDDHELSFLVRSVASVEHLYDMCRCPRPPFSWFVHHSEF